MHCERTKGGSRSVGDVLGGRQQKSDAQEDTEEHDNGENDVERARLHAQAGDAGVGVEVEENRRAR